MLMYGLWMPPEKFWGLCKPTCACVVPLSLLTLKPVPFPAVLKSNSTPQQCKHWAESSFWTPGSRRHLWTSVLFPSILLPCCRNQCALLPCFLMSLSSLFLSVLALLCLCHAHMQSGFREAFQVRAHHYKRLTFFVRLADFSGQQKYLKGGETIEITLKFVWDHWLSAAIPVPVQVYGR